MWIVRFGSLVALLFAMLLPIGATAQTLPQMVEQLRANPSDDALRGQIIEKARAMRPPPAVPEEAERFLARGAAATKSATSAEDFKAAAAEFQKAADAAPWLAEAYYNKGVVLEKANDPAGALTAYRLYLAAAPNASDAKAVRTKIFELEYLAEKKAATPPKPAAFDIASIAGAWRAANLMENLPAMSQRPTRRSNWSHDHPYARQESQAQVAVTASSVRITVFPFYDGELATEFDGQYANGVLSGTVTFSRNPHPPIIGLPPNYAMTQNLFNQLFPCGAGSLKERLPFTAEINVAEQYTILFVRGRLDENTCRTSDSYYGSMLLLR